MSLIGFKAQNHPQQTLPKGGPKDEVDDRATHPLHFAEIQERLGLEFTLDVAAAAHNAKCPRFFDREQDGLRQSWAGEVVWCNPPYSSIEPWLIKAWQEAPTARAIVMLLPANRTEQKWWQRHVEKQRDRIRLPRRVPARPHALHQTRPARRRPQRAPALRMLPADLEGRCVVMLVAVGCDAGCGRVSLLMPDLPGARARARLDGWRCDPATSTHWCPDHQPVTTSQADRQPHPDVLSPTAPKGTAS